MTSYSGLIFTLSAGRTGTAWLADFLGANLGVPAIHEPLGIDDFGVNMPDIKTMRSFNERGLDGVVRAFWEHKFANIGPLRAYIETNHTLAKCGLIESLAASELASRTKVIVLSRDKLRQCVSYLMRGDFANITVVWQWYLSPTYRNVILSPKPFQKLGQFGPPLWYAFEMEARQIYYRTLYGDKVQFIDARLETVSNPDGAKALLGQLGVSRAPTLPPRKNANPAPPSDKLKQTVAGLISEIKVDTKGLVDAYLASGRRLDRVAA